MILTTYSLFESNVSNVIFSFNPIDNITSAPVATSSLYSAAIMLLVIVLSESIIVISKLIVSLVCVELLTTALGVPIYSVRAPYGSEINSVSTPAAVFKSKSVTILTS